MARGIQAGDKAPDFTLPSQSGEQVRLQDRLGERVVVLYFYPKDNTPGCTAEACAFRDSHEVFTDAGAEVIGISSDSVARHTAFADRHRLPFTLLSDQGGQVRKSYGVPPVLGLLPGRVRLLFQRAEEVVEGALTAMGEGAITGVDRIFALHCDPRFEIGQIGLRQTLFLHVLQCLV